jgi:hypothetical protein
MIPLMELMLTMLPDCSAAVSSSSTSGRTRASTGCARCRTSGRGTSGIAIAGVVVGVHVPEFGFEHDLDNVRRAASELDVGYPVVIDNDFTIWRSFENH